jgi:hypothetical protein
MSIGVVLKLFVLALIVFAVAFGLRRTFLWDVMPVSSDQAPQSLWVLGAAFLLRSLENIAAVVAGLAVIIAGAMRLIRWRAALNHTLRAIDPRGVAAGRGEVNVQVCGLRIGEQARNRALEFLAIDQGVTDHHAAGIEGSDRERARPKLVGNRVDRIEGLVAAAHKDGKPHPVGRIHGVMSHG